MQEGLKSRPTPPDQARILVAEDDPVSQMVVEEMLRVVGIGQIKIVGNGLDVLKASKDAAWDIILMDCHMPDSNGYEAAKGIRSMEKTTGARTPIIAITANAMPGDKEKCRRHGMDAYIDKPISINKLKGVLRPWIDFGP